MYLVRYRVFFLFLVTFITGSAFFLAQPRYVIYWTGTTGFMTPEAIYRTHVLMFS